MPRGDVRGGRHSDVFADAVLSSAKIGHHL